MLKYRSLMLVEFYVRSIIKTKVSKITKIQFNQDQITKQICPLVMHQSIEGLVPLPESSFKDHHLPLA